jgi:predicted 2-oxoglutarate/Fe(II)-dependent dioxygenase YbiX
VEGVKVEKTAWQLYKEQNSTAPVKKEVVFNPEPINFTKVELAPGVWIYKNVFPSPDDLVAKINAEFESSWQDGQVFSNGDEKKEEINKKFRDCSVVVINKPNEDSSEQRDLLYKLVDHSMRVCLEDYTAMFGMSMNELTGDEWQVLKYGHGQHFDGHADDGFRFPRTVSITAYLNDEYEGGELDYKHFNLFFKPEKGDVLVFPSNYVYNHRVVEVKTGVRYALVNWFRWKTMKVDMLS